MSEIAWAAYNKVPPGMEPGLEAVSYYDPPNMTYPFGAYICVMDIDVDTGVAQGPALLRARRLRHAHQPDDHRGPGARRAAPRATAIAMGQEIVYDEIGNVKGASFMDYFLPTAVETPHWETDYTVTPSPHHPIGAKGVGESPNVGSVPCFANAVNDAFKFLGSTHIPMPHDAYRTWLAAEKLGLHGEPRPSLTAGSPVAAKVRKRRADASEQGRRALARGPLSARRKDESSRCPIPSAEKIAATRRSRLCRRSRARDRALDDGLSQAAAAHRGRGGGRQDGGRQGARRSCTGRSSSACSATRGSTRAPRSTSGTISASSSPSRRARVRAKARRRSRRAYFPKTICSSARCSRRSAARRRRCC